MSNSSFTTLNNSFPARATRLLGDRPLSLMAAAALPVSSFIFVHHAAEGFLPPALVGASLGVIIAVEWLQWTALDRIAQLEAAREDDRAGLVKALAFGIGALQVAAYTFSLVLFGAEAGMAWGSGWALAGCLLAATLFAALNFFGKHAYADAPRVQAKGRAAAGDLWHRPTLRDEVHDARVILFDAHRSDRVTDDDLRELAGERDDAALIAAARQRPRRMRNSPKANATKAA